MIVPVLALASSILATAAPVAGSAESAEASVAIVAALDGTASVSRPGSARRPVRLFEWLPAGTIVEAAEGSRVTIAFLDGRRFALEDRARLVAGRGGPERSTGTVSPLAPFPPLPRVAAIQAREGEVMRVAAVRIRRATIRNLYPRSAAAARADGVALTFDPVAGATGYSVEIEDEQGRTVFQADTTGSPVSVPASTLAPGRQYFWHVKTAGGVTPPARGEAGFKTLDDETAAARARLKESVEASGEPGGLALLAEIDRTLGLLIEARDELRAAGATGRSAPDAKHALDRLERLLAAGDPYLEREP
jgi:hypothetical protein